MTPTGRFYLAVPAPLAADGLATPRVDSLQRLLVVIDGSSGGAFTPPPPSLYTNFAASDAAIVKASPGLVASLYCRNRVGVARYVQLFNQLLAPVAGNIPLLTFLVPGSAAIVIGTDFFTDGNITFSTGIAWGFSVTETVWAPGGAGNHVSQLTFR